MRFPLGAAVGLELLHHGFNRLGLGSIRDQHRIIRFHHH